MPADGDLTGPVAYSPVWGVLAVVLPLLVVAWYAGVTWWTRDREASHAPAWLRLRNARREHLRRLARIEAGVAEGSLSTRQAHQAVSSTVRSYVAAVGAVDARSMNLRQLREAAPLEVVAVVEHVYPPAFEPDGRPAGDDPADDPTDDRLVPALRDARKLVSEWRP